MTEFKDLTRIMTVKGELGKVLTPDGKQVWPVFVPAGTVLWRGMIDGNIGDTATLTNNISDLRNGVIVHTNSGDVTLSKANPSAYFEVSQFDGFARYKFSLNTNTVNVRQVFAHGPMVQMRVSSITAY